MRLEPPSLTTMRLEPPLPTMMSQKQWRSRIPTRAESSQSTSSYWSHSFMEGFQSIKIASGTNFPFIIYILPPHKFSTRPVVFEMEIEFERWPERHPAFTWIWTGLELDNYHYPRKLYFTYVRRGMFWQTWNKIIWL